MRVTRYLLAGLLLAAAAAPAQTIVDNVPGPRGTGPRETAQREIDDARLRAGPIRVLPVLEVWGVGWDSNVSGSEENPRGDVVGNALGGARGILPVGHSVFLRGFGGASYSWFLKSSQRRHLGFAYDGSLLAYLPRLNIEAAVQRREGVTNFESELDRPVIERTLSASADVEVVIARPLSIFGNAMLYQPRYSGSGLLPGEAEGISALERTDTAYGGGLRLRLGESVVIGAQAQETRYRFRTAKERDSDGTGYLLGISYTRPRLYVVASGGWREFRPLVETPKYRTTSGIFGAGRVEYSLLRHLTARIYGARRRTESLAPGSTFFVETFGGTGATYGLGQRGLVLLSGWVEYGKNDYDLPVLVAEVPVDRRDDVLRLGGSLGVPITPKFRLTFTGSRSRFDSNVPGFDHTVYRITGTISYVPRSEVQP